MGRLVPAGRGAPPPPLPLPDPVPDPIGTEPGRLVAEIPCDPVGADPGVGATRAKPSCS